MPGQLRSKHTSPDQESLDLLQHLIDTPPSDQQPWKAPVVLRSAAEQRSHALGGYLFRTWFDGLLQHTERLLIFAAVLIFGYWLYDGPIRDWLYFHSVAQPVVASAAPPISNTELPTAQVIATAPAVEAVPLPFTTPAMTQSGEDDFIAPRSAVDAAPVAQIVEPERLQIPAVGLDTVVKEVFVREGVWEVADYAAGYMHGTALPGEKGTMALAGHAGLRGGVFRDLGALQPQDDILIDAAGWRYRYRVRESFNVLPTETSILAPAATPILVLITCTNWDTERLIVRADLVESRPIPEQ
jgi:sortase A